MLDHTQHQTTTLEKQNPPPPISLVSSCSYGCLTLCLHPCTHCGTTTAEKRHTLTHGPSNPRQWQDNPTAVPRDRTEKSWSERMVLKTFLRLEAVMHRTNSEFIRGPAFPCYLMLALAVNFYFRHERSDFECSVRSEPPDSHREPTCDETTSPNHADATSSPPAKQTNPDPRPLKPSTPRPPRGRQGSYPGVSGVTRREPKPGVHRGSQARKSVFVDCMQEDDTLFSLFSHALTWN